MAEMASGSFTIGDHAIIIALHTKKAPSEAEWEEYLAHGRKAVPQGFKRLSGFTITDGGAPNSLMRKKLEGLIDSPRTRGAVITDQALVRGVVTALSWVNPRVRAFAPSRADEALVHLDIDKGNAVPLWDHIAELSKQLDKLTTFQAIKRSA